MKGFISDTLRTHHEMQLCALCDAFFFFFHNSQLHNIVAHSCCGRVWFSRCHLLTYSHT